jgi:hypothetical protein
MVESVAEKVFALNVIFPDEPPPLVLDAPLVTRVL